MSIVARNPKAPRWHIVVTDQNDVDDKDKFAFEYTMLTLEKEAQLRDNILKVRGMGDDREEKYNLGQQDTDILKTCVKNWRNLKDESGKDISFNIDSLDYIPPKVREEMIRVIRGEDALSPQRKKEYEANLK